MDLKNIRHTFDTEVGDVGCTIRKGDRWHNKGCGVKLDLWNCSEPHGGPCNHDCINEGKGRILGSWLGPLECLPSALLKIEHNMEARSYDVLKKMLEVGYGKIDDKDEVTALIYIRTE